MEQKILIDTISGLNPVGVEIQDYLYNFILHYFLRFELILLIFLSTFVMETLKDFSENTKFNFTINDKWYGVILLFTLIVINWLLIRYNITFDNFIMYLIFNVLPAYVVYSSAIKHIAKYFRHKIKEKFKTI